MYWQLFASRGKYQDVAVRSPRSLRTGGRSRISILDKVWRSSLVRATQYLTEYYGCGEILAGSTLSPAKPTAERRADR
jgi:hypothetical protein